jgi:hypothetical protein
LLAILKKQAGLPHSLYTITQILSLTLFEKTPLLQAFERSAATDPFPATPNQFNLFD